LLTYLERLLQVGVAGLLALQALRQIGTDLGLLLEQALQL